jgi:exopolysaccharide biosynthesis polyprenyl glycosylphosphotransferase
MSRLAEELRKLSRKETEREQFGREMRAVIRRLVLISIVGDVIVILGILVAGSWLKFARSVDSIGPSQIHTWWTGHAGYMAGSGIVLLLILAHFDAYHPSKLLHYRQVSFLIIKSCALWLVGMVCLTGLAAFHFPLSPSYAGLAAVNLGFGLLLWRLLLSRISSGESISKYLRERILFVGWNEMSERFIRYIVTDPSHAYSLVGCVPSINGVYEKEPPADIPHLAAYDDLRNMLRTEFVDIVILAERTASMKEIDELANICEKELVRLMVIPSYFQILTTGLALQTISGIPILAITQLPLDRPLNRVVKRAVDIVGAMVGLVVFAPVMAVFATIVYLESPGPVIYRQRRSGRGGVPFDILKIRSMRLDAESGGKPGWTVKDDPRRLKIGAFMRSWNIDELPQFWNVLKGEMSLVGPRPERPELIASFKEEIIHYQARHTGKPGVTGWAAINGLRGDTDLTERIRCDIYYLENWSVWLDFQIMFLTFFRRKNAG